MGETQTNPNMEGLAMSIHQQVTIPADPERIYQVLADAEALSALSGMGGTMARTEGEEFVAFDGNVTGRQIELVPGVRIVQAWRFPRWEPGQHSLVSFTLTAVDGGTRLTIDQHGEPDDWHDHIAANWPTFYLTPLMEHFDV
jgi:activator of HSP90 ATPase